MNIPQRKVYVPAEISAGETRVAVTTETVKKLKAQGHEICIQKGAGVAASCSEEAYEAAGAVLTSLEQVFACQVLLKVRAPTDAELLKIKPGAVLVGMLNPFDKAGLSAMAAAGITSFALEAAPRTTRAQSMDVLSSQANITGYNELFYMDKTMMVFGDAKKIIEDVVKAIE